MASGPTFVVITVQVFVACLALSAQDSDTHCFDASGVCITDSEVNSVLLEDSNIDHLSYVQMKTSKVVQATPTDPSNPIEQQLEKASAEAKKPNHEGNGYTPPPPDDFGGSWQEIEEQAKHDHFPIAAYHADITWAYEPKANGVKGPSEWGKLGGAAEACGAGLQSPIDLSLGHTVIHPELTCKDLELNKETTECDMENAFILNPHTIVRQYEGNCSTTFKATWREKDFFMVSFHYSSPSEHTFDGAYYPMEVQHVHKAADDDQKLIIAVMIAALNEDEKFSNSDKVASDFMAATLNHMPSNKLHDGKGKNWFVRYFASEMWDPYQEFLKGHLGNGFWHYVGTTTSPPCHPDTVWMIDPVPIRVKIEVIGKYRKLINKVPDNTLAPFSSITGLGSIPPWAPDAGMVENGWNPNLGCNIRPTQPMDGRTLWGINVTVALLTTAEPLPGDAELSSVK